MITAIEATLASDSKEMNGLKCELVHEFTERHKVIQISALIPDQQKKQTAMPYND